MSLLIKFIKTIKIVKESPLKGRKADAVHKLYKHCG